MGFTSILLFFLFVGFLLTVVLCARLRKQKKGRLAAVVIGGYIFGLFVVFYALIEFITRM
ncbi:MAG: hypothetical protein IJ733_09340 [Lachnospiraceae bacterium]|nr:hypothetical protein [Lachnospiraceae bacterium]